MPCQNNKLKTGPNSTVARLPPGDHDGYLLVRLATVCGECVPASQQACQFSNMRPIVRTAVKWKQLRASRSGPTADRTTLACTPNMLAPPITHLRFERRVHMCSRILHTRAHRHVLESRCARATPLIVCIPKCVATVATVAVIGIIGRSRSGLIVCARCEEISPLACLTINVIN